MKVVVFFWGGGLEFAVVVCLLLVFFVVCNAPPKNIIPLLYRDLFLHHGLEFFEIPGPSRDQGL